MLFSVVLFVFFRSICRSVLGSVVMERGGVSVSVFKRERGMDRVRMRPPTVMCPHSSDMNM